MPSFSWAANLSGDWNTGARGTPGSVSNTVTAEDLIGATAMLAAYTDGIASGDCEAVAGDCCGALPTFVNEIRGALDDFTVRNSANFRNELAAFAGTMMIGGPIREISGDTPNDGMFNLIVSQVVIGPDGTSTGRV